MTAHKCGPDCPVCQDRAEDRAERAAHEHEIRQLEDRYENWLHRSERY